MECRTVRAPRIAQPWRSRAGARAPRWRLVARAARARRGRRPRTLRRSDDRACARTRSSGCRRRPRAARRRDPASRGRGTTPRTVRLAPRTRGAGARARRRSRGSRRRAACRRRRVASGRGASLSPWEPVEPAAVGAGHRRLVQRGLSHVRPPMTSLSDSPAPGQGGQATHEVRHEEKGGGGGGCFTLAQPSPSPVPAEAGERAPPVAPTQNRCAVAEKVGSLALRPWPIHGILAACRGRRDGFRWSYTRTSRSWTSPGRSRFLPGPRAGLWINVGVVSPRTRWNFWRRAAAPFVAPPGWNSSSATRSWRYGVASIRCWWREASAHAAYRAIARW